MAEDWSAVAKAINERVNELGWRQRELAERSHVSQAIVREIQHCTVERRRSKHAAGAAIVFNSSPKDTADAALRWLR